MALVFRDTFTDTAATNLVDHTPDTGTSWTELIDLDGAQNLQIGNITANALDADDMGLNDGIICTADATYPNADYEVSVKILTKDSGDDVCILVARATDANNMYSVSFSTGGWQIRKRVSGTVTSLGVGGSSIDIQNGDDIVSFVVNGTTIEFRINGKLLESVTDSSLTSAGKAGIGFGDPYDINSDDPGSWVVDDFRVHTLGDQTSQETLRPNAAGDASQMTAVGDTNNYECVDESTKDDDTTYVKTPAGGFGNRKDLYNLPASGAGASDTIDKVTVSIYAARGANWASSDLVAPNLKIDSAEFPGQEVAPAATTYELMEQVFYHNPADGTVWTKTDIDALQAGLYCKSANLGDDDLRVTQVFVTVDYTAAPAGGATFTPKVMVF